MKTMPDTATICPLCGAKRSMLPTATKAPGPNMRKAARSLAAHLAFVHNIREGQGLACILGTGLEQDNFEALTQWVWERISHLKDWPLSSSEVSTLIDELERALGRILEGTGSRYGHGLQ